MGRCNGIHDGATDAVGRTSAGSFAVRHSAIAAAKSGMVIALNTALVVWISFHLTCVGHHLIRMRHGRE
jgi:hypothetical protein